jgi:hypothetical protein
MISVGSQMKPKSKSNEAPFPQGSAVPDAKPVPVSELCLDPQNPRLTGHNFSVDDQDEILKWLWKERNVSEITDSITSTRCFWKHEPLIAAREGGKLLVIEGNRRLAAVMLLLSSELQQRIGVSGVPAIDDALRADISTLPVIEKSRKDVWDFVGFKHVNGPQEWDSIAKAEYITRIHDEFEIPLERIAKTIGDRNDTVLRLYHGYCVLRQAKDADVFKPEDRWNKKTRFAYSHLWTGLGYAGIQSYLGIKPDGKGKPNPVPKGKLSRLGKLCLWLYGSEITPPLIRSQNPDLRVLDEALRSPKGQAALERGLPLQAAYKASRGDTSLLREALVASEQNLREAKGYVTTGYEGQTDIFETAENVVALANSLLDEMRGITKASASRKRE